jgi:D-glycero-alpha-D-manno-heptose 1-phosphate guanylyltransferase
MRLQIVDTALILAGGLGTRLRSEVSDVPKPMAPIKGKPFLEYQISYWINQGVSKFILSTGYMHQVIQSYFGSYWGGAEIKYVVDETPLGTGGSLIYATEKINQDKRFLLLNGDTYFPIELKHLIEFSAQVDSDWTLSLFQTNLADRYMEVFLDETGRIKSFGNTKIQDNGYANGGVYLIHPRALNAIRKKIIGRASLEEDIFPFALSINQKLYGLKSDEKFIDIGVPEDYKRSARVIIE